MKKFIRVLAMCLILALVMVMPISVLALEENELPPIPVGGQTAKMTGFSIINLDSLPPLIEIEKLQPGYIGAPAVRYQIFDQIACLQLRINYSNGTYEDKYFGEAGATATYSINGPESDENTISITIGDYTVSYTPEFAESPVASIEILQEPTLVLGENSNAVKIGEEKGVYGHWDAAYPGLEIRINYTDGTSDTFLHESLTRLPYSQSDAHTSFYNIPKFKNYNVNIQRYMEPEYQEDAFVYWGGHHLINEAGVIPMMLMYMGKAVRFNVHVQENSDTQIVWQPLDAWTDYKEIVELAVGVTGQGLQYQWQYQNNAGADWKDYEGGNASTLLLTADEKVDGLRFRCKITDGAGAVLYSDVASVTVNYPIYLENFETYQLSDFVLGEDGFYKTPDGFNVYIGVDVPLQWLGGESLYTYVDAYGSGYFDVTFWDELVALTDENGFALLTEQSLEYLRTVITGNSAWGEDESCIPYYLFYDYPKSTEHKWKEATCTEPKTCSVCGETEGEALGHSYTDSVTDPTCTEDGYTTHNCVTCGHSYTDSYTDALGHTGGTATCKSKAVCTRCSQAYGELNPHNHVGGTEIRNAADATCTASGYTGDTVCLGCKKIIQQGTTISPLGHHMGDWIVVTAPSPTSAGEQIRYCQNAGCNHSETESIPKLQASNGWVSDGTHWYYFKNGKMLTSQWLKLQNNWYYLDATGVMATDWLRVSNKWYYFGTDGIMRTDWQRIEGEWYYFGSDGAMKTGWQQIGGKWYYLKNEMKTGWQQIGGKWYYLDSYMVTGWQRIDGQWYYLNSEMKTGWQKISGSWYYLGSNGAMRTNWQKIGNSWYYLGSNGIMRTGWQFISNEWYYLGSDGAMRTGTVVIGGKTYIFDSNGIWIG